MDPPDMANKGQSLDPDQVLRLVEIGDARMALGRSPRMLHGQQLRPRREFI